MSLQQHVCKCIFFLFQTVLFPALTVVPSKMKKYPLKYAILDQITFDCDSINSKFSPNGSQSGGCMNETALARSVAKPLTEDLLTTMFKRYTTLAIADESTPTDTYMRALTCGFCYSSVTESLGPKMLGPMVETLSKKKDALRDQKVEKFINHLVDAYKVPFADFMEKLSVMSQNYTRSNVTYDECLKHHFDDNLSHEAKAMFFLVIKLMLDHSSVTLGSWHRLSNEHRLNISAREKYMENFADLKKQVIVGMESLLDQSRLTLSDVMLFLGQSDTELGLGKGKITEDEDRIAADQYKEILKVAKYIMMPFNTEMTELARVQDMKKALNGIKSSFGRKQPKSFTSYSPAVLYCDFDTKDNKVCQTATTTFTQAGLGYTFNTESFFRLYKTSQSMETFCQEVVERTDLGLCSHEHQKFEKQSVFVKSNGPKFALRLLLFTPQEHRFEWSLQKLVIHSPHSIGDALGNFIIPNAGTHTTVVVTPHITETDGSLLNEDKMHRGCHSQEHDDNPLKLFHNYTKENCVFECNLKNSIKKCNCVPWDYPKLNPEIKTCSQEGTSCFEETMENSKSAESCPECLDECFRVDYEYTVHTTPMQDICGKDKKFSEEVRKAVKLLANQDSFSSFLPNEYSMREMGLDLHLENPCYFFAKANMAWVDVQIGPASAVRITRRPRVTFVEQLGNLGMSTILVRSYAVLHYIYLLSVCIV